MKELLTTNNQVVRQTLKNVFGPFSEVSEALTDTPVMFKEITREARRVASALDREALKDAEVLQLLQQGVQVDFRSGNYITTLSEPQYLKGGIIKKLANTVDKRTKSPKTTRGTIYRRNSTVIERRRAAINWKTGDFARSEQRNRRKIGLIPLDQWEMNKERKRLQKRTSIDDIRFERGEKAAREQIANDELIKRFELYDPESLLTSEVIRLIQQSAEKNGVANREELERRLLNNCKSKRPQSIIFIWGPPYEGQGLRTDSFTNQPEQQTLGSIAFFMKQLAKKGLPTQPILLYADTYGTDINGIPQDQVDNYFNQIRAALSPGFATLRWSQVKLQNNAFYNLMRLQLEKEFIIPSEKEIENAKRTQQKIGRNNLTLDAICGLARAYKMERIIEGRLLTRGFSYDGQSINCLIKLGTAPSRQNNDDPYEPELPRFYLAGMPRAPWNKPRR